jgi:hypothetical protein
MKKILISAVLIVASICTATAQARLNFYGAYVFDDGFEVFGDANNYYNGKVKGGFQWGAGAQYVFSPSASAELLYINHSTTAPTTFKFGTNAIKNEDFNVNLHYIMASGDGLYHRGKAEGYAGFMMGALITDVEAPSVSKSSSHTSFAWGGRLGTTIWTSERIGIKLQALLLSSSHGTGGETYFTWYGPIYLTTYSTLWQFSLGGGLTFKLGK